MYLFYNNGNNFQTIPAAYDFGSNTAEDISNVIATAEYYPSDGSLFMEITAGAGSLGGAWDQSTIAKGSISVPGDMIGGTIIIGNVSGTVLYGFLTNLCIIVLYPGNYSIQINYNGTTEPVGTYLFSAGSTTYIIISIFPSPVATFSGPNGLISGTQTYTYHGSWKYTGETGTLGVIEWNNLYSACIRT